jgi:hypothetical protein
VARIESILGHPRFVALRFEGSPDAVWSGIARHGRPIQYAHVPEPLALWDVWTPLAAHPVAFEPPSASFVLDWRTIAALRARAIELATVTLAAGLSSTGDPALDARLPLDEPYRISAATAAAVRRARARGGRIVAVGTTVVRALEHAAAGGGEVGPGDGVARGRIGASMRLAVADAVLSGTHEPGSSHHELLRAFAGDRTLAAMDRALVDGAYRTHEFGDSILIERADTLGRAATLELDPRHTRLRGVTACAYSSPWKTRSWSPTIAAAVSTPGSLSMDDPRRASPSIPAILAGSTAARSMPDCGAASMTGRAGSERPASTGSR